MALKIRKGDTVVVIAGKDRGRRGTVQRVLAKEGKILVEGVNRVVRHLRARPGVSQAGRVEKEMPLHLCKVMLVCPRCDRPTRVGFTFLEDGKKVRVCKKCRNPIE